MNDNFTSILAKWIHIEANPFFNMKGILDNKIKSILPKEYLMFCEKYGGHEGFLGKHFFRLYRMDEVSIVNQSYEIAKYAPDLFVFGSNGLGEAFAFNLPECVVVQVPYIPLTMQYADKMSEDFMSFLFMLAESGDPEPSNPDTLGLEITQKHPICLGGDPVAKENIIYVPPAKHSELARFWNKVYFRALNKPT